MSKEIRVEILIGGELSPTAQEALKEACDHTSIGPDGRLDFDEAVEKAIAEGISLFLATDSARYETEEPFYEVCREYGLAIQVNVGRDYESDCELSCWQPGDSDVTSFLATAGGSPVITLYRLEATVTEFGSADSILEEYRRTKRPVPPLARATAHKAMMDLAKRLQEKDGGASPSAGGQA